MLLIIMIFRPQGSGGGIDDWRGGLSEEARDCINRLELQELKS